MLTLEEVSKRFNVSTKTISRWRVKGLTARRVKVNGRSQLGFPAAAVEKFVAEHKVLVEKGARFSHLTESEKDDILRLARELRDNGCTLTEVSKKIATATGAQPGGGAIHDQELRPHSSRMRAIPARQRPTESRAAKEQLVLAKRQHDADRQNAKPTGDTVNTHRQAIRPRPGPACTAWSTKSAPRNWSEQPVDYIYNAEFDDPSREDDDPRRDARVRSSSTPSAPARARPRTCRAHMAHLYEWPLLNKEQEQHVSAR